mmetsp:Transcript_7965/g.11817  ORF Transcript_7965/g.11817 Transcript_7965/m.11817 type:complete len:85 (-) Transcript_7965:30-284(-)
MGIPIDSARHALVTEEGTHSMEHAHPTTLRTPRPFPRIANIVRTRTLRNNVAGRSSTLELRCTQAMGRIGGGFATLGGRGRSSR